MGAPHRDPGPLGHCVVPGLKCTEREKEKRVEPCRQDQQAGCSFSCSLVGFWGGVCLIWGFGRWFFTPPRRWVWFFLVPSGKILGVCFLGSQAEVLLNL